MHTMLLFYLYGKYNVIEPYTNEEILFLIR